ncbi:MAG: hypothetical protein O7G87_23675 [bacterium]|nr:hypothetical protein [bacterium]
MEERKLNLLNYVGYLICWVIAMGLGFLDLVSIREVALGLLAVGEVNVKLAALVDKIGFFFFGVIGLVILILSEAYYRVGLHKGILLVRFGLVTGIELLTLFVCDGILLMLPGLSEGARPGGLKVIVELVTGVVGVALFLKRRD